MQLFGTKAVPGPEATKTDTQARSGSGAADGQDATAGGGLGSLLNVSLEMAGADYGLTKSRQPPKA